MDNTNFRSLGYQRVYNFNGICHVSIDTIENIDISSKFLNILSSDIDIDPILWNQYRPMPDCYYTRKDVRDSPMSDSN